MKLPEKLSELLRLRSRSGTLRSLKAPIPGLTNFSSNDYLGLAERPLPQTTDLVGLRMGSGGSRLLGGNSVAMERLEVELAGYYGARGALVFNSGYDANLGILSSIPRKGDGVLFDEYAHASIRDGLVLTQARSLKFRHNDLADLRKKALLMRAGPHWQSERSQLYIATESVFSMDGDSPDITGILEICEELDAYLLLDEAHRWELHDMDRSVDAWLEHPRLLLRLVTFGKALGLHGAAVLGSEELKEYLVNFARSFIYTTALPEELAERLLRLHQAISGGGAQGRVADLRERIAMISRLWQENGLQDRIAAPDSAIQALVVGGVDRTRVLAGDLAAKGFFVKPIWSPTVPEGTERLRICLNSLHTFAELEGLVKSTAANLKG